MAAPPRRLVDVVECQDSAMRFAWKDTEARLDALEASSDAAADPEHPLFGTTLTLDAPGMPTIGSRCTAWRPACRARPTANARSLYVVLEGHGSARSGTRPATGSSAT
ncbi:hypothetical protein C7T35_32855 [Variovorax sp. WS11]|nr:hypothetical protein C7T35_32855 [Variovorax sp. WS11]